MCRSCGPLFGENLLTLRKTINNEDAMSLEKQINDEIKAAMLAKEKVRLTALRAVKSEILLAKTADGSETIADGAVLKIVQKLVKQRRESAAVYTESGRPELAENELAEAAELEGFLPAQMSGVEAGERSESHYRTGGSQSAVRHG